MKPVPLFCCVTLALSHSPEMEEKKIVAHYYLKMQGDCNESINTKAFFLAIEKMNATVLKRTEKHGKYFAYFIVV